MCKIYLSKVLIFCLHFLLVIILFTVILPIAADRDWYENASRRSLSWLYSVSIQHGMYTYTVLYITRPIEVDSVGISMQCWFGMRRLQWWTVKWQ